MIDPLGGSYYVERLTDQMEAEISAIIARIDEAGGMYAAAEQGLVQELIGRSALEFQQRVESGEQKIVGVNAYRANGDNAAQRPQPRPSLETNRALVERLKAFKAARSQRQVEQAIERLAAVAQDPSRNLFAGIVEATEAGATHGEIVACLRRELGFGQPRVAV